ncbi:MAG: endonuclease MutS2 [Natronincolaceae bacterium]|jgi:DNA mismatch repair protein MutS2|nr:endonuclease MutS2 [Bacillota bacterium]NLK90111.1 endonuclease MutS2 [Clostridiales bacterium]
MNERSLRVLEYPKIINMLEGKCTSSLGKEKVRDLQPISHLDIIKQLQQETGEAQSILIKFGNVPLSGINDVSQYVRRTEIGSYLDPAQLLRLKDTLAVARRLKNFLKEKEDSKDVYVIIRGLIQGLVSLKEIEDKIDLCIVSETEISDNASMELKRIRRQIVSKNESIRNKLNSIITSTENQKYLQDAIITIRQDRYVVPVKQEYRAGIPGLVHDRSSSGATLFVEPMAIVELNNEARELKIKERTEIERILMEISAMIAERAEDIKSNQTILKELDFIFAKGKLSLEMKAVEPELNTDGEIVMKDARHPLLKAGEVVPNTIWIGDDFHILIITGPNTGGKTVTLKMLGLLTLMAQSGLHVPTAYGTKMAVFDGIFADIGDEQSIEQSLSTFSSHMTNIVTIINSVTPESLVLLDELGAGTDPTEGAALAMAILNHLKEMGTTVVATTHYSELKQYALSNAGVKNAAVEFDVETLSPTYKLLIGIPGRSNAFEISKKLGLPDFLIDRSRDLLTKETIHFEDLLQNIEKDRSITEQEKLEAAKLRIETEKLKEEYERKNEKLRLRRERIVRGAKKEAYKIIKQAKSDADEIINNLKLLKIESEEKEMNRKIEEARQNISKKMGRLSEGMTEKLVVRTNKKPPKNLKAGEAIKVLPLNQTGYVISPEDENGEVQVQVGIMKVNMHVSNLERAEPEKEAKKTGTSQILRSKAQNINKEIDVRGQNLEEAMLEVDKYLDDSYIAGLTHVTVIHGVGTGVLGAGLKQMFKKHKHVKKYREGAYGEGGAGVTIVYLK